MYESLLSAFLLGLIGGVIPGPVLTAVFTEILQSGIPKGMRIILWAMLMETIIALISLWIFSSIHYSENFFFGISIIGSVILLWISTSIWKVKSVDSKEKVHFSLGKITAMIMANGILWTFWITVCIPKAIILSQKLFLGDYLFLILVEIGWLISTIAVAIIFSRFRKVLSHPKAIPVVYKIFSLVFIYFALDMLIKSIRYFLCS